MNEKRKNYKMNTGCFRYIVPFEFTESFEDAFQKIHEQMADKNGKKEKVWKLCFEEELDTDTENDDEGVGKAESDLFAYIRNEYKCVPEKNEIPGREKLGAEFRFADKNDLEELIYIPGKAAEVKKIEFVDKEVSQKRNREQSRVWSIKISDLGLILFRNHLGFLWYEIKLPLEEHDSDELVIFQNIIRELSSDWLAEFFWKVGSERPSIGLETVSDDENKAYISPFFFGQWISDKLSELEVRFLAERKPVHLSKLQDIKSAIIESSLDESRKVVSDIIMDEKDEKMHPDKALLFTYCSFFTEDEREEQNHEERNCEERNREKLTYYLTNGYNSTICFSEEVCNDMKHPFGNVLWYATQEGAAYFAWVKPNEDFFFKKIMPGKVRNDYFTLYIKVLYQSYSLMLYAGRIQKELYLAEKNEGVFGRNALGIYEEINLFLAKSMATSVSHIHHQSMFYNYLKKQIRVHEDVKSVTAGLSALDALRREQRQIEENKRLAEEWEAERKRDKETMDREKKAEKEEKHRDSIIQAIMGLFAILGIFSALVDCYDFIEKFSVNGSWTELSGPMKGFEILGWIIIGVVGLPTIIMAIGALISAYKNRKSGDMNE